jgi:hypothetical protein
MRVGAGIFLERVRNRWMCVCVRVCVTMIYRKSMCERAYKLFLVVVEFDYSVCVCVRVSGCVGGFVCVIER